MRKNEQKDIKKQTNPRRIPRETTRQSRCFLVQLGSYNSLYVTCSLEFKVVSILKQFRHLIQMSAA